MAWRVKFRVIGCNEAKSEVRKHSHELREHVGFGKKKGQPRTVDLWRAEQDMRSRSEGCEGFRKVRVDA